MNFTHMLWVKMSTLALPKEAHKKDKGAGFVEYAAILVFVAVVAGLIVSSGVANTIVMGINNAIRGALNPTG
ncbi:hypothetical protein [Nocardiopsis valliformis]|uniref:hypothetical protein n=1 Tax=Nocardiopsis valliformis TaxID=239974 RepID=UPI000371CCF6|nr:hypothetical protein [Nocardiopsis valliformis]